MGAYFTLESSSRSNWPNFGALHLRLLQIVKLRLDNGEFTERGLARVCGISQPQIHNLIKGARRLNQASADTLLAALNLSVLDLLTEAELSAGEVADRSPMSFVTLAIPAPGPELSLLSGVEPCPRENPAHPVRAHFGLTKQAS